MSRPATKGIVGRKFGRLTVLKHVSATATVRFHYLCSCDCGRKTKVRDSGHLIDGKRTSCGCSARQRVADHRRPHIDLAGMRFGLLTAKKHAPTVVSQQGAYWLFKCDCGTSALLRAKDVSSGNTASCGCRQQSGLRARGPVLDVARPWRKEAA